MEIKSLRQSLLKCSVINWSKVEKGMIPTLSESKNGLWRGLFLIILLVFSQPGKTNFSPYTVDL
jgi:hypothetical protein